MATSRPSHAQIRHPYITRRKDAWNLCEAVVGSACLQAVFVGADPRACSKDVWHSRPRLCTVVGAPLAAPACGEEGIDGETARKP